MSEQAMCKGCGAPIIWAITAHGKRIPLNKPEKRFILMFAGDYYEARLRETYTSHFADCPNAGEFRKAEKG